MLARPARSERAQRATRFSIRSGTKIVLTTVLPSRARVTVAIFSNPHFGADGKLQNIIMNVRNITQLNYLKYQLERGREHARVSDLEKFRAGHLQSRLEAVGLGDTVLASPIMTGVLSTAEQVAEFDSAVLLSGETGVGKGIVAKFIHRLSRRAEKRFIEVNCGAIPDGLVESELFGYQPGAFTGSARSGKKGQFEVADGGTIFLDEVSELPLASQTKLLKFLDDKVLHRLGSTSPKRVDVRVLAATNKNLRELAEAATFRKDLLYRLEVIPLYIPPLRERREDVRALLCAFLEQYNKEFRGERAIASEAMPYLVRYDYPGNVRELKNLVARLVLTARGPEISVLDLPDYVRATAGTGSIDHPPVAETSPVAAADREASDGASSLRKRLEEVERHVLAQHARSCRSTYEIAARLGVHQSSVVRKLRKYGISLG